MATIWDVTLRLRFEDLTLTGRAPMRGTGERSSVPVVPEETSELHPSAVNVIEKGRDGMVVAEQLGR